MSASEQDPAAAGSRPRGSPLTRRNLLITGSAAGGALLTGYSVGVGRQGSPTDASGVPHPPSVHRFFDEDEVRVLTAMVGRLIPGDDSDPGAVQAGVTFYIDAMLVDFEAYAEPTYRSPPFALPFDGDRAPATGDDEIPVPADELHRYGYQSSQPPQELYRLGLAALDRYAQTRFGRPFDQLGEGRQDALLAVLDDAHLTSDEDDFADVESTRAEIEQAEEVFGEVDPGAFFTTVRSDCIAGMFSDPEHGGNRGLVGWIMLGFPGAQRSYSPAEMLHGTDKLPQSKHGLTPMRPDHPGDPGRGALEQHRHGVVED